jgi:hypothetical protein
MNNLLSLRTEVREENKILQGTVEREYLRAPQQAWMAS